MILPIQNGGETTGYTHPPPSLPKIDANLVWSGYVVSKLHCRKYGKTVTYIMPISVQCPDVCYFTS